MSAPARTPATNLGGIELEPSARSGSIIGLSGGVILLATDGSQPAIAAARMALALAQKHTAVVRVVSVVDTRGAPIPPPLDTALGLADASTGDAVHAEQANAVLSSLAAGLGADVQWPVRVTLGTPARAIAREARRCGAALVIVGLRRHGKLDRATDDETTLNLMRNAPCPVLGVVADMPVPPRRVLAAVDFSRTSLMAARLASGVCGGDAKVILAYAPSLTTELSDNGEAYIHRLGLEAAFTQLSRELSDAGVAVDHVVLHHTRPQPPSELLLEYAEVAGCDVIATGAARHGRVERWILGSVSTDIVRDGRRSVLVVPPPERKNGDE